MFPKLARLAAALILCPTALAQAAPPARPAAPASSEAAMQALYEWRVSRIPKLMNDWGELERYRTANAALPATAGEDRVVFFGDSIVEGWRLGEHFPQKPYINRGISGQTTSQMLVRFRADVIDLQPKAVLILAGSNDIAGNTGPMSVQETEANYASMAELAHAHGIRVVFASVLPVHNYTPRAEMFFALRPRDRIVALNRWLKDYCAANGDMYLDYYSAMVDERGLLKRELADDGLHPNPAGYKAMAPLTSAAIARARAGSQAATLP